MYSTIAYWAGVFILSVPVCLLIFGFFQHPGCRKHFPLQTLETLSTIDYGNTFQPQTMETHFSYRVWKHFPLKTMETQFLLQTREILSAVYYGNTFRYRLGKHFQLQTRETLFAIYCRLWIHFPSGEEEKRQKRLHWLNKS